MEKDQPPNGQVNGMYRQFTVKPIKPEFAPGYPLILKMDEVAEILRVSRPTAYELARQNDFPVVKIGRRVVVSKEPLADWVREKSRR